VSKDLTWSAPVWYDPANADAPLTVGDPTTPPAAPTNLTATAVSSSQINLSWTDSDTTESGFKIERCTGANCGDFAQIATVGANVTNYFRHRAHGFTSYNYRVRAYNSFGDSSYSDPVTAETQAPPAPPNAPSNLIASAVSSSQINLAWTDTAGNETGFKIERCTGVGCADFAEIATVGANVTNYSDTGLTLPPAIATVCGRIMRWAIRIIPTRSPRRRRRPQRHPLRLLV